jgi:hypothetical protein
MYSQGPPIPAREPPAAPTAPRPEDWQVGLQDLLECIDGQREPASTGAHGRHALEVIAALHLSSRNNMQPVSLPVTGDALQFDLKFR